MFYLFAIINLGEICPTPTNFSNKALMRELESTMFEKVSNIAYTNLSCAVLYLNVSYFVTLCHELSLFSLIRVRYTACDQTSSMYDCTLNSAVAPIEQT